ncbi:MAG TPA: RagB/SusD family nutrient uptake outer membrane protein [Arenibacter sp.]|nr:RagB/SusD family nutrient uptake outer membrane protein [Arenibacter sp.]
MKSIKIKLSLLALVSLLGACNKDFLELYPLDEISSEDFWKTANDVKLYANTFYPQVFSVSGSDRYEDIFSKEIDSDDMVFVASYPRLRGTTQIPATGGWDYSRIRSLNYFLENYQMVEDDFDTYKAQVGEIRFFRAYTYFDLVKAYGDVPWIGKTLDLDSEELYSVRTPRNVVIDSIIADLNRAIDLLPSGNIDGKTRLNKNIAKLFKSRVCLFEGTWEKYHDGTVFGVANSDPEKYLSMAVSESGDIIDSGDYQINNTGNPEWDYFMFGEINYLENPEVLLWKEFNRDLGMVHGVQYQMANGNSGGSGITKNFVESYLMIDGKPITNPDGTPNPLYMGDETLSSTLTNRDPRARQTIFTPGFPIRINSGNDTIKYVRAVVDAPAHTKNTTGYQLNKGLNWDPVHSNLAQLDGGTTGKILFRYAEALLNYAEAKAELGTLTQTDLDISINKLRDRVAMPHLVMGTIQTDPNWSFPNLSPVINEIRRERRVELVAEGFRWNDIARWAAADELIVGKRYLGAKFNNVDYPGFAPTDFKLTDGYFDELKNQIPEGNGFVLDRDYLDPIATEELNLNPNLDPNPNW